MDVQAIKRTFGIIGTDPELDRAIGIAAQVAATDLTVLITGESGTGKDVFPKIIHQNSTRKHGQYFAVNCGAIPEGTIDSELFGHEKGSFTGAVNERKGYFEIADKGTLFLDEVGELPLSTQARLLRVLENGEFIRVGGNKVMKTDVRIVAATNVDLPVAIERGRFREDLYYRLNTIPIHIPALRERKADIPLLFRKFAADFAERNHIPAITLMPEAVKMLENYRWDGNVRQLKNVTEQISIMETDRNITTETLAKYLPNRVINNLPILLPREDTPEGMSERDLLYRVLFDMKKDIAELRAQVNNMSGSRPMEPTYVQPNSVTQIGDTVVTRVSHDEPEVSEQEYAEFIPAEETSHYGVISTGSMTNGPTTETLSLEHHEKEMIIKALEAHRGKRKDAAKALGISERTLYRKINEYGIDL
ncbi:MAG: sigma-54-dependent Fis family transcriptional regulator [Bacteroidales bacterium]|nr:sigma-54-dependent Fis family transcriptional regulator [Bacteroidales bacterium]